LFKPITIISNQHTKKTERYPDMQFPSFRGWPVWDSEEIDAVQKVITSGNWGDGNTAVHPFPVVSEVYDRIIQLPHHLLLSEKEQLDGIAGFIEDLK
jgi:hypothetical protein